jgi:hypothetical protein
MTQIGQGYPVSPLPFGVPDPNSPLFSRRGFTLPTAEEFRRIISDSRNFQPVGFRQVSVTYPKLADCPILFHPLEQNTGAFPSGSARLTDFWQTEYVAPGVANCVAFCRLFNRPDGSNTNSGWADIAGDIPPIIQNVCSVMKFDQPIEAKNWPGIGDPAAIPIEFGDKVFSPHSSRFKNPILTIRGVPFERLYIAYPAVEEIAAYQPDWFNKSRTPNPNPVVPTWNGYAPKAEAITYTLAVVSWYDPTVISLEIR